MSQDEPSPTEQLLETRITIEEPTKRKEILEHIHPSNLEMRHGFGLAGVGGLVALPVVLSTLTIAKLIASMYIITLAMSWDFVSGYTGQFSFGHALFFGLGGYTTAVLNIQHGVSPLMTIPAGILLAAIAGVLIGVPALRIEGPYLALVTLIAPLILIQLLVVFNTKLRYIAPEGLGGRSGIASPIQPVVGTSPQAIISVGDFETVILVEYFVGLIVVLSMTAVMLLITRTTTGDIFTAIREDEKAVRACGINPAKFKIFAFVLSAAIAGFAGAMFVHSTAGDVQPAQLLVISISINVVIMTVIGGLGTIVGAAVGALFFEGTRIIFDIISRDPYSVTVPVADRTPSQLMPIPLLVVAALVTYYMRGGVLREAIIRGRIFYMRWKIYGPRAYAKALTIIAKERIEEEWSEFRVHAVEWRQRLDEVRQRIRKPR